jgi:hypothetical protein
MPIADNIATNERHNRMSGDVEASPSSRIGEVGFVCSRVASAANQLHSKAEPPWGIIDQF